MTFAKLNQWRLPHRDRGLQIDVWLSWYHLWQCPNTSWKNNHAKLFGSGALSLGISLMAAVTSSSMIWSSDSDKSRVSMLSSPQFRSFVLKIPFPITSEKWSWLCSSFSSCSMIQPWLFENMDVILSYSSIDSLVENFGVCVPFLRGCHSSTLFFVLSITERLITLFLSLALRSCSSLESNLLSWAMSRWRITKRAAWRWILYRRQRRDCHLGTVIDP